MQLRYLLVDSTDAAWNLAAEQYVFDALPRCRSYWMLWQNRRAVVVGKYQNTLAEINEDYVRENGVQVVRRLSGGGAVYHDLGNLNYTVVTDAGSTQSLDFRLLSRPLLDTLRSLGVPAELNGRNDICVEGKKISGNSQYRREGRVMQHGTILFDSDLSAVEAALRCDPEKLRGKAVASVRSRVTNLRPYLPQELTLGEFRTLFLQKLLESSPGEAYVFTERDRQAIEAIRAGRYARREWNYGASSVGAVVRKKRVEGCGTVGAEWREQDGCIAALRFFGDFFSLSDPDVLAEKLIGLPLERNALRAALEKADVPRYISGLDGDTLSELLLER